MTSPSRLLLAIAALFLCTPVLGSDASMEREAPRRIIAIGDLHGDYEAYLDIIQAARLSNANGSWKGGHAILVQMGDVPDRGPDTLKIIVHLQKLQKAAARKGGEVVVLLGNHEAMNVTGDLRYVSAGEYEEFRDRKSKDRRERVFEVNKSALMEFYRKSDPEISEEAAKEKWFAQNPLGKIEHRIAWSPKGKVGKWVIENPATVKFGDTLFVHGGISIETAARPIEQINAEVHTELAKGESYAPSILTDPFGPLWYRGNVEREESAVGGAPSNVEEVDASSSIEVAEPPPVAPRPSIGDELTQVLMIYDANRLVVGHTPNPAGIVAKENGRLIQVDTGISAYYGGARSYLEIKGETATAFRKDDQGKWVSRQLPAPGGNGS